MKTLREELSEMLRTIDSFHRPVEEARAAMLQAGIHLPETDGVCDGKTVLRWAAATGRSPEDFWKTDEREMGRQAGLPVAERDDIFPAQPPTLQL